MIAAFARGYAFAILLGFVLLALFGEAGAAILALLFVACAIGILRRL